MSVVVRSWQQGIQQLPRVVGGRAAAPPEWETWEEEPGHDLVALEESRAVGGIHVSLVGRGEAWLENLRVHPECQGRGIASRLVKDAEEVARRYGAALVRTAIPAQDYAAQTVAERGGYRRSIRCVVVEAPVPSGPVHMPYDAPVDWPGPDRTSEILDFIDRTPTMQAWEHLLPLGWRFRRVVAELVRGLIKDRRMAVALRPGSGQALRSGSTRRGSLRQSSGQAGQAEQAGVAGELQGSALFSVRSDAAVVSLVDGSPSGMQAVYGAVLERAQAQGATHVVVFAADLPSLAPLGVRQWSAHQWCPDGLVIVEKKLAA